MSRSESLSVDMSDGPKDVSECVCGSDVSEEISLEEQAVVWIITPALIFLIFIILIVILMLMCRRPRVIVKTIPFEDSEESIVYMEDMKEKVETPTNEVDMRRLRHHTTTQMVYSPIQVNELPKHRVMEKTISFENPMESIVCVEDMTEVVSSTDSVDMRQLRHQTSVEMAQLPIQIIELPKSRVLEKTIHFEDQVENIVYEEDMEEDPIDTRRLRQHTSVLMVHLPIQAIEVTKQRVIEKAIPFEEQVESIVYVEDLEEEIATPTDPVDMRRLRHHTSALMAHPPIQANELPKKVKKLKANNNELFSQEYESIEPEQQFTWEISSLEMNRPKNRYVNVVAYDHSRVVLQTLESIPGSDYINANFCDGYRKQNAYIATQGPLPDTYGDFWRMVWEQNSTTIVMLSKLVENERPKCDQYWPNRGSQTYGVMYVSISEVQELATYCIRTFNLERVGSAEKRQVTHFQFTAWPDHGVPSHPASFLMFIRRVRSMLDLISSEPIIVHCSAGVGRTGCFVVIDSMLERLKHETTVDIYGHVTCLRAQRNYMVQTEDQYIFTYNAVLEASTTGLTEVLPCNLYSHIQQLLHLPPGEKHTKMELEFQKLSKIRKNTSEFVSANLPVNKLKNRFVNILPYESTMVSLEQIGGMDGSDYINANYIDGYRHKRAYIATQGPLANTTADFWRMLWEQNCRIIVMLTKVTELEKEKCHQYWPDEKPQRHLYFTVVPVTEYNMPHYIMREFRITDTRNGQSRTIRQFHFMDWPEKSVPKSGERFIEFIGQVLKTKHQFGQEGPVTIHCCDGVGRTGVFIMLSIVLERMTYEGVIDIFQYVCILRTQRPGMVQTEEQYQFCYRATLEYVSSMEQ